MLVYRRLERLATSEDIILDLGTKNGKYLTEISGTIIGVDIALEFPLEQNASYLYGDGRKLPFDDDSFNYIILNQVLEHVSDRQSIVSEVSRVLKPNGEALFSFPVLGNWVSILKFRMTVQEERIVIVEHLSNDITPD